MSNGKSGGADGMRNGTSSNLLFAIPKKGRLNEKCMQLLAGAGLDHKRPERVDVAHCNNIPVRVAGITPSCCMHNFRDKAESRVLEPSNRRASVDLVPVHEEKAKNPSFTGFQAFKVSGMMVLIPPSSRRSRSYFFLQQTLLLMLARETSIWVRCGHLPCMRWGLLFTDLLILHQESLAWT